tara:strand:+ start:19149 stop:19328 length:180 start_codon:yes stop_codon:yes gene_type:complete
MIQIIVKTLMGILANAASAEVAEWVFFKLADVLVKKTETKHDDEFLAKIKEANDKAKVG